MSQNNEDILQSKEIIKLADRPKKLFPLWEEVLGMFIALVFSLFFYYGFFNTRENQSIDVRFKQRGELQSSRDIVLVSITDDCVEKLGSWPWPRETHAKLLKILKHLILKQVPLLVCLIQILLKYMMKTIN